MTAEVQNLRLAVEAYGHAMQAAADGDRQALTVWLGAAEAAARLADRWQARAMADYPDAEPCAYGPGCGLAAVGRNGSGVTTCPAHGGTP